MDRMATEHFARTSTRLFEDYSGTTIEQREYERPPRGYYEISNKRHCKQETATQQAQSFKEPRTLTEAEESEIIVLKLLFTHNLSFFKRHS